MEKPTGIPVHGIDTDFPIAAETGATSPEISAKLPLSPYKQALPTWMQAPLSQKEISMASDKPLSYRDTSMVWNNRKDKEPRAIQFTRSISPDDDKIERPKNRVENYPNKTVDVSEQAFNGDYEVRRTSRISENGQRFLTHAASIDTPKRKEQPLSSGLRKIMEQFEKDDLRLSSDYIFCLKSGDNSPGTRRVISDGQERQQKMLTIITDTLHQFGLESVMFRTDKSARVAVFTFSSGRSAPYMGRLAPDLEKLTRLLKADRITIHDPSNLTKDLSQTVHQPAKQEDHAPRPMNTSKPVTFESQTGYIDPYEIPNFMRKQRWCRVRTVARNHEGDIHSTDLDMKTFFISLGAKSVNIQDNGRGTVIDIRVPTKQLFGKLVGRRGSNARNMANLLGVKRINVEIIA